jgi:hypothetical protein
LFEIVMGGSDEPVEAVEVDVPGIHGIEEEGVAFGEDGGGFTAAEMSAEEVEGIAEVAAAGVGRGIGPEGIEDVVAQALVVRCGCE